MSAARFAGSYELTFALARRCREAIKGGLKERRAKVSPEAAESIGELRAPLCRSREVSKYN
ncbi:hypothetical protein NECAME_06596 [Necator americanus]|uniref:Uncharacterized protein n=1 Tax=Necator americanus TaxID=51031 RepID=W2TTS1_NECAM|nr:hypothetical protein NECAME_06596 [Necator americanus]ETN85049.1 hypothetical protein NECAME_06596 [Necator americanus]